LLERERAQPAAGSAPCESANDGRRSANEVSPEFLHLLRQLVQTLMWMHVGIVRSDRRLTQALREVTLLHDAVENLFHSTRVTEGSVELRNIALVGQLIIRSALHRKESRGLHPTVDHPGR